MPTSQSWCSSWTARRVRLTRAGPTTTSCLYPTDGSDDDVERVNANGGAEPTNAKRMGMGDDDKDGYDDGMYADSR